MSLNANIYARHWYCRHDQDDTNIVDKLKGPIFLIHIPKTYGQSRYWFWYFKPLIKHFCSANDWKLYTDNTATENPFLIVAGCFVQFSEGHCWFLRWLAFFCIFMHFHQTLVLYLVISNLTEKMIFKRKNVGNKFM